MSSLFDRLSDELERATQLTRLQTRGAVRLALSKAGLEAATLTLLQLRALLPAVLPDELAKCGVRDAAAICAALEPAMVAAAASLRPAAAPEDMFRRIRGR